MGKLFALLLAIILGLTLAVLQVLNIGNGFSDKSVDAQATRIVDQATAIELALDVYKAEEMEVVLGDDVNVPLFQPLINKGYLKQSINGEIQDSGLKWEYDSGNLVLKKVLNTGNAENTCHKINNIRHKKPLDYDIPSCADNPENLACCYE